MAYLMPYKDEKEIKSLGVAGVREYANKLSATYKKMIEGDLIFCHGCNEFHGAGNFYTDNRFASGVYPLCKKTLLEMATDYDSATKMRVDNKGKTIKVFEMLNLPFIDSLYNSALQNTQDAVNEKNRSTAFQQLLVMVKSLPQYKNYHFENSEFDDDAFNTHDEINENSRIIKQAKKRFGNNYNSFDLLFLEEEYQDWISRYPCENKAQEILYENICITELNIDKKQKNGRDIKDDLKTLQDLMTSLQIKPSQTNSNALTEAKTFGQLIEKWEDEWDGGKPIPEPDPDFADIDKIGTLIDVFYKGHLAKMMGLKNGFTSLYEKFMKKFTVNMPQYDEDSDSEAIFEQLFGKDENL